MKKLLFTLVLLFSLHSFGQNNSFSNPVSDAFIFKASDYYLAENAFIVPEGKFMIVIVKREAWSMVFF